MRRGQTRAHLSRRRRHAARCQTSCSTSIWRQHVWFGAGKWGHFARAPVEKYRSLAESHIAECANARFRPPLFFCTLPPTHTHTHAQSPHSSHLYRGIGNVDRYRALQMITCDQASAGAAVSTVSRRQGQGKSTVACRRRFVGSCGADVERTSTHKRTNNDWLAIRSFILTPSFSSSATSELFVLVFLKWSRVCRSSESFHATMTSFFIDFRRSGGTTEESSRCRNEDKTKSGELGCSLSGSEARLFYEGLIASVSTKDVNASSKQTRKSKGNSSCGRKESLRKARSHTESTCGVTELLRAAQDGDLGTVQRAILEEGCDVNCTDSFSWTPLMCSCHAGHERVVCFLLEHGAEWRGVHDAKGRDARQLAVLGGHQSVVGYLDRHAQQVMDGDGVMSTGEEDGVEEEFCSDCDVSVKGTRRQMKRHFTSTTHLINAHSGEEPCPHFGLPPSNVGFQLLVKEGWDMHGGLGPTGKGRRYPVKTELKNDRGCVGGGGSSKRVTHFEPYDVSAVTGRSNPSTRPPRVHLRKKELLRRQENARRKERQLRWELSDHWA